MRPLPVRSALAALLALLAACAQQPPISNEAAPQATACPKEVAEGTRCLTGRDSAGAFYLIAKPAQWNGVLVMHAHGGPTLGEPKPERSTEDLQRWAIVPKAGYAWAGSTFRQGGVAVRSAAEDTERLRRIFIQHVAQPRRTLLHGQSWGASVAAKGAEMFAAKAGDKNGEKPPYDAVLLTSGVLAGGTRSYDFRLDLRVIYQHLCGNHPRADEPAYPLWRGLPEGSALTSAQLSQRTRECLGLGLPAGQRTPEQARKLKTLVDVLRIPERSVQGHLNWATFHFKDIADKRTGGRNVFGNTGAVYTGSPDDAALNAVVQRYRADPQAVADFGADTDPTGRIPVPVLTVHGIDDPIAFVELEHAFGQTMQTAGRGDALVQTFTADHEHSYLSDPVYPTLLAALLEWVEGGSKPTPAAIAQRCETMKASFGDGCRFRPDFQPPPLDQRVAPRSRP